MAKGISTIVATILMLIITISLVGTAYFYLSGVITSRTNVVLTLDPKGQQCIGDKIITTVTNLGTSDVASVEVRARNQLGTGAGNCSVAVNAQSTGTCEITRLVDSPTRIYSLQATGGGDTTTGTVSCPDKSPSLLAGSFYFEEGSGTSVVDSSANGYVGTLYNLGTICSDPPTPDCPRWVTGSSALEFVPKISPSTVPHVRISGTGVLESLTDSSFTFAARVKPTQKFGTHDGYIVARTGWHTGIYFTLSNRFGFTIWNSTPRSFAVTAPSTSQLGVWHHVAGVVNDTEKRIYLYVDGVRVAQTSYIGPLRDYATATYFIGSGASAGFWNMTFNGTVDEVRFYNQALSAVEISVLAG